MRLRFVESSDRYTGDTSIVAYNGRVRVGELVVNPYYGGGVRVVGVEVVASQRRRGLATRLYEYAARRACESFGDPLTSDVERTAASEGFWAKQVRKGRATCVEPADLDVGDDDATLPGRGGCRLYKLTCPAPASLAHPVRRKRR